MNEMNQSIVIDKEHNNILDLSMKLQAEQYNFSLFSLLRYLESYNKIQPNVFAKSHTPLAERITLRQDPSLAFPTSEISNIDVKNGKIAITINSYGLLAINSPLPSFLLEYVFQRHNHHGDKTWTDFINMLQHRLITIFYRSWANAQSITFLESPHYNRFNDHICALAGLEYVQLDDKENHVSKYSKLYFIGFLLQPRSAHNFTKLLTQYFQVPVNIEENIGEWCVVPSSEQTRLGSREYSLGDGLLLGTKIYNCATKFRIIVSVSDLESYELFLHGNANFLRVCEWIDIYLGKEYSWDIQPILHKDSIPKFCLGKQQLGLTTWLGQPENNGDTLIISGN